MTVSDLILELEKIKEKHGEHCEVFIVRAFDKEFNPNRVVSIEFKEEFWESEGEFIPNDCIKLISDY